MALGSYHGDGVGKLAVQSGKPYKGSWSCLFRGLGDLRSFSENLFERASDYLEALRF